MWEPPFPIFGSPFFVLSLPLVLGVIFWWLYGAGPVDL
jgi:hypothetical protein